MAEQLKLQFELPDGVITVICAPDNVWSYHPKHVEQFTGMK
jgi:hypothetical protein